MAIRSYLRSVKRTLWEDRYILQHRTAICSDHNLGEGIFELAVSREILQREDCTLLQVGANTGKNKHDVFDHINRWQIRSILIEPQPDVFEILQENYAEMPYVSCVNAALSSEKGSRKMYRISDYANRFRSRERDFGTGIASFEENHVWMYYINNCTPEGCQQEKHRIVESFDVPCITLEGLLEHEQIERVDVLLIDVEGFDFEILKMIDFDKIAPSVIKFEHKHLTLKDRRHAWDYLRTRGFKQFLVKESGDTVAIRP